MNSSDVAVFGFPDFAKTVLAAQGPALRLAIDDSHLGNEMIAALPKQMTFEQIVIYMLVRMTITGWVELVTLVGSGCGLGAMKISRGMFETAVMAEYLRRTPAEMEDYIEYGRVLNFKQLKSFPESFSPEQARDIEAEYERVTPRFANTGGKIRGSWNKHSIASMAQKIGRGLQYEIAYSLAASIHHGNFEAMVAHLSGSEAALDIDQPPSLRWIKQALASGHVYLLQAFYTLNEFFSLGFDARLDAAGAAFEKVWRQAQQV
jgi:hypothetical protein